MAGKKALRTHTKDLRMRQQLAQEAARIIAEEGIADFHIAKQKAALRLHAPNTHNLPRNDEIQLALRQYQRLFQSHHQPRHLEHLRRTGRKAMDFLKPFEPRLVGAVLDGTATEHSAVTLHLFCDTPEELLWFLFDQHIPFEQESQSVTMPNDQILEVPCFHLALDGTPLVLLIFDKKGLRQAPRCPTTGKPMQRLNINKVDELIQLSG